MHNELQLYRLAEVEENMECVNIVGVKVIWNHFCTVTLGPFLLSLLPFHLHGYLSVRFVPITVKIFQFPTLNRNLKHSHLLSCFLNQLLANCKESPLLRVIDLCLLFFYR